MSLECFDKAIYQHIKSKWDNTIFAESDDKIIQNASQDTKVVKFPLISIIRMDNTLDSTTFNDNQARFGSYQQDKDNPHYIRSFPCVITYQIDILSNIRSQVDALWREIIYLFYNKSSVDVEFPSINEVYNFNIQIEDTSRTTDADFTEQGRIHRQSITLKIPHATMIFKKSANLVEEIKTQIYTYKVEGDDELEVQD